EWFGRKEMDTAFADAAFALKTSGDISEPIQSQFGWHVIRLEARRAPEVPPFDQVRDVLLQEQRKRFVDERREAAIANIRRDAQTQVNREAVDALTPRVDIDAAKRALGMTPGAPTNAAPPALPAPR
ncbi:MAG: peptidyl-prolyl cis-trans isomerase, partial [Casimicrobiaceae bacterium]